MNEEMIALEHENRRLRERIAELELALAENGEWCDQAEAEREKLRKALRRLVTHKDAAIAGHRPCSDMQSVARRDFAEALNALASWQGQEGEG